jgi:hypothetical protein
MIALAEERIENWTVNIDEAIDRKIEALARHVS